MRPLHESSKSFELNAAPTSIALAPNRKWILIGCADGTVRCEVLAPGPHDFGNEEVGRIIARGLNTCLQVTVAAAEDSRVAFAGAMKGAIDVLAFEFNADNKIMSATKVSDAKIRGLMACTRVRDGEYRLLCGRGIKNVHVWKYLATSLAQGEEQWALLYDLATANASVRVGGFIGGSSGSRCFAKSEGQNLRVWEIKADTVAGVLDIKGTTEAQSLTYFSATGDTLSSVSGMYNVSVATLAHGATSLTEGLSLSLPPAASAGRRAAPRTVASIATAPVGASLCAVACNDGAVAVYNAELHQLNELALDDECTKDPSLASVSAGESTDCVAVARWTGLQSKKCVLTLLEFSKTSSPGELCFLAPAVVDEPRLAQQSRKKAATPKKVPVTASSPVEVVPPTPSTATKRSSNFATSTAKKPKRFVAAVTTEKKALRPRRSTDAAPPKVTADRKRASGRHSMASVDIASQIAVDQDSSDIDSESEEEEEEQEMETPVVPASYSTQPRWCATSLLTAASKWTTLVDLAASSTKEETHGDLKRRMRLDDSTAARLKLEQSTRASLAAFRA